MNEFLLVLGIACIAAFLTYLAAPAAERIEVPPRVLSAALQFAAGVIAALVVFSLMPPAIRAGSPLPVALAFFCGGALFVFFDYISARRLAAKTATAPIAATQVTSLGLYFGAFLDVLIDGMVIGIGSALTLSTGLLLAFGVAVTNAPLVFVVMSAAKRQGMAQEDRRRLSLLLPMGIVVGAVVAYGLLRSQPLEVKLILVAMASGFLITTVTQSLIPEALSEDGPQYAGIFFIAGLTLSALLALAVR